MNRNSQIAILGGGVAGLAVGYYARKKGIPFTVYEATDRIGGNCITFQHDNFLFDSGAHRLHDKDREITEEMQRFLGPDLKRIEVPSQIFHKGKLIDFPLSPFNLLRKLGPFTFAKAGFEVILGRMSAEDPNASFERFALRTYGRTIADAFLLNYSEKLWGAPCARLSRSIAGERMKGLNLRTFLVEAMRGQKAKTEHMEGSFYYPKHGIGTIMEKLAEYCGQETIVPGARVSRVSHDGERIQSIEINGKETVVTDRVVSTLPLHLFLQMMDPPPPGEILSLAQELRYRNLVLVAIFLQKESITSAATVYFPGEEFRFTRVYEPRNRSAFMSPPGCTSLVAEFPCQDEDRLWRTPDDQLVPLFKFPLIQIGWIREDDIIDAKVARLHSAYPILELGFEEKLDKINAYLKRLRNLRLSGRNGMFQYSWIHNMLRYGKDIVEGYVEAGHN